MTPLTHWVGHYMPRDARFGNAALCAALEAMKLDFQGRWTRTPCLGLNFQQPFSLSPRYCATAIIGRNASSGSRSDAKPFPRAIQKRERRSRDIRCHRAKCRADYSAPGTTRSRGLSLLAKYPLSRLQRFIDHGSRWLVLKPMSCCSRPPNLIIRALRL